MVLLVLACMFSVQANVNPIVTSENVFYSYMSGGFLPPIQCRNILSATTQDLTMGVTGGVGWFVPILSTRTTPSLLTLLIAPEKMGVGNYHATVNVYGQTHTWSYTVWVTVSPRFYFPPTPMLQAVPSSLNFVVTSGSTTPLTQNLNTATSNGNPLGFTINIPSSQYTPWLSVPANSYGKVWGAYNPITVQVNPYGLMPGVYTATLDLTWDVSAWCNGWYGFCGSNYQVVAVPVTLTVVAPTPPPPPANLPSIKSVMDAVSGLSYVAPGSWVAIYGSNLSNCTQLFNQPLPWDACNTRVDVNGIGAPVYFTSPNQINVLVPYDLASVVNTVASVRVITPTGLASSPILIKPVAPALFAYSNNLFASATHTNGALIQTWAPAHPGEAITLYGAGFGQTANVIYTNGSNFQVQSLPSPVTVKIAGVPCKVLFSGAVGVGLYQFNVVVPTGLPAGIYVVSIEYNDQVTQFGPQISVD